MIEIRAAHPVAPVDLGAIRALHAEAERVDGFPSLGEAVWRDLETGGQPASAGVFASEDARLVGYAHVAPSDNAAPERGAAGMVVAPTHREGPIGIGLLNGVVEHAATRGMGEIVLWLSQPTDADDVRAVSAGFACSRDLLQMRVALPLDHALRWPTGFDLTHFRPGHDEAAWLRVNNRAFADHPEQGHWTEATLARRTEEPWFDPDGFLLAWAGEPPRLAGFCWTKIHRPSSEIAGLGEIFVVGVDPDHQGTGLGRALVIAGLDSLAARGARTGLLYVDGANEPAVTLYTTLGFTVHRRDRAYERLVP